MSILNANDYKVIAMQSELDALCDEIHSEISEGYSNNPKLADSWPELVALVNEMNALINGGTDPMLYFVGWLSEEINELRNQPERQAV